ncbi:hypothetical protein HanIR_Chr17g0877791 [Helianthus annuus]|nr:hypothetical protein HanIR_Chr17g0877791 [Helianthus annuus]
MLNYCACLQLWLNCYVISHTYIYRHPTLFSVTPLFTQNYNDKLDTQKHNSTMNG